MNSESSEAIHRLATLLVGSYPRAAVSSHGAAMAREYLACRTERSAYQLSTLDSALFEAYIPRLLHQTGWSEQTWSDVTEASAILEIASGCVYACEMCYIDAPMAAASGYMPWRHIEELLENVARVRRKIIFAEALDVAVNDVLRGRLKEPFSVIEVAIALARHGRNRFANHSDHLMTYWRSNPTNYGDPLFRRDYADVNAAVAREFQLFDLAGLLALIDSDKASAVRFKSDFGEDAARLQFATTTHAVTSSVPFAKGSAGDRAIQRMLTESSSRRDLVRLSIPHPSLIPMMRAHPDRYFENMRYALRVAEPRVIYLFATSVDELYQLVEQISASFERSEHPWWIESRLAMFEIRKGRERQDSDATIVERLRRVLRSLSFIGGLEGRGAQFAGNPLFIERKTVMCVNGIVLSPGGLLHYQACTTPAGEDLSQGVVLDGLETLREADLTALIRKYPLVNRAREAVTRNLAAIPFADRRKPWGWFAALRLANQQDARYTALRSALKPIVSQLVSVMRS